MLLDTLVCCAPFTQFLLEKMSQYFFQTTPIYFFMLAFFHKTCIIDNLKLKNDIHAPLSVDNC